MVEAHASALSRAVVANVRRLQEARGVRTTDLIHLAGLKPNYFYTRMRAEADFTLGDVQALADVLGSTVAELTDTTLTGDWKVRTDGRKLASRLAQLIDATPSFDRDALVAVVQETDSTFSAERWASLQEATPVVRVSTNLLSAIASYFDVESVYLTGTALDESAEKVEAELDFRKALRDAGATSFAMRALGDVSPDALRAIAEAVRSVGGGATE